MTSKYSQFSARLWHVWHVWHVTYVTCKFHFCCLDSCLGQLTRRSKNGDSEVSAVSALQHLAAEATKPRSLPRWGRPNVPGTACGMGLPGAEQIPLPRSESVRSCWNLAGKPRPRWWRLTRSHFSGATLILSTETSLWEHFSGNDEANVLRQWKSVLLQSRQHPIQPTQTKELKGGGQVFLDVTSWCCGIIEVCLADRTTSTGRVFMFLFQRNDALLFRCRLTLPQVEFWGISWHFIQPLFSKRSKSRHKIVFAKLGMFVKFLMAHKNNRSGGLAKVCWEMLGAIRVESSARRKLF